MEFSHTNLQQETHSEIGQFPLRSSSLTSPPPSQSYFSDCRSADDDDFAPTPHIASMDGLYIDFQPPSAPAIVDPAEPDNPQYVLGQDDIEISSVQYGPSPPANEHLQSHLRIQQTEY